jgi:hypothetical protein
MRAAHNTHRETGRGAWEANNFVAAKNWRPDSDSVAGWFSHRVVSFAESLYRINTVLYCRRRVKRARKPTIQSYSCAFAVQCPQIGSLLRRFLAAKFLIVILILIFLLQSVFICVHPWLLSHFCCGFATWRLCVKKWVCIPAMRIIWKCWQTKTPYRPTTPQPSCSASPTMIPSGPRM